MNRILHSLASVSIALAPLAIPTAASADPGKDLAREARAFCEANNNNGLANVGQCVAWFEADDSANIPEFCRRMDKIGSLDDFGFSSVGDCVAYLDGH